MTIKHKFTSTVSDGADATLVRPSNWNDDHEGGLNDLDDVNLGTPAGGDVLTYDGTAEEWISDAPSGGGGEMDILMIQVFT